MKNFILTVLISVMALPALYSQKIDSDDALKVAVNKIILLDKAASHSILGYANIFPKLTRETLFFVFELQPKGYIVVTSRKDLPPVIAYSFKNSFGNKGSVHNPLMELLIADIEARILSMDQMDIESIEKNKQEWKDLLSDNLQKNILFEQWPPEGTTTTGGWLETNWTQNAPYLNFCPIDPVTSQRSYVGCPATAMAQIVNYFKAINETQFFDSDDYYHSYAGRNYWIDDSFEEHDFLSFLSINKYLDSISSKYEESYSLSTDEKAALSFACGVAANQVYTSEGSGTFGVSQAYDAYMKFGFAEAILMDDSDSSIYSIVKQNMMDARPNHLALVNESWTVGHNVVIDGYNTEEFYHFNFGWGGSSNGWYLLPPENIPYELTLIEGVIANIAYPVVFTGFSSLGIENMPELQIFPNPATEFITIATDLEKDERINISIQDSYGRTIYEDNKYCIPDNGRISIDIDFISISGKQLKPGIYFLTIETSRGESMGKFVIGK